MTKGEKSTYVNQWNKLYKPVYEILVSGGVGAGGKSEVSILADGSKTRS